MKTDPMAAARAYYCEHYEHIDSMLEDERYTCPPYGSDFYHPELWSPEHWRWFFSKTTAEQYCIDKLILEAIEEKDKASQAKCIEDVEFWVSVRRWLESH